MVTFMETGEMAAEGCLVKPVFHQVIQDQTIPLEITVKVARPLPRKPDGWFHASQHPLASPRELYRWLAADQSRPMDRGFDYRSLMSVMFGSLAHGVMEALLDRMGVAVPLPPGICPACGLERKPARARSSPRWCTEHGAVDIETRSRCHLDSILDFGARGTFGFDLKTCHQFALSKVPDMDEEAFREKWPGYWAQMQECMRLTGLRRYIVFFLTLGNPWDTREFHFEYDPVFAAETEAKYRRVISCFERGVEVVM
jgi:hypothetical protein